MIPFMIFSQRLAWAPKLTKIKILEKKFGPIPYREGIWTPIFRFFKVFKLRPGASTSLVFKKNCQGREKEN